MKNKWKRNSISKILFFYSPTLPYPHHPNPSKREKEKWWKERVCWRSVNLQFHHIKLHKFIKKKTSSKHIKKICFSYRNRFSHFLHPTRLSNLLELVIRFYSNCHRQNNNRYRKHTINFWIRCSGASNFKSQD